MKYWLKYLWLLLPVMTLWLGSWLLGFILVRETFTWPVVPSLVTFLVLVWVSVGYARVKIWWSE